MACLITQGRNEECSQYIGGLYKVWFANFGTFTGMTINVSNQVSAMTATTIFEYELKGNSKLTQTIESNENNGTTYCKQTLVLELKGGDYNLNNEIKLLAYGRPHAIVQDNYGNAWVLGRLRGLELKTAQHETGANLGDKYGYVLTFEGMEKEYGNSISGATLTNAFVSMGVQPTITKGTN